MTKYINKKTKTIIDVDSVLRGNWVEVGSQNQPLNDEKPAHKEPAAVEPSPVVEESEQAAEEPTNEGSDNLDGIKKKEIMQELDAMGKKYNPRDKKEVLYDLMMSKGK